MNPNGFDAPVNQFNERPSPEEIQASMIQEERVGNVIGQTSPDRQLVEIEWRIKGYRKDPFTRRWIKIDKKSPEVSPVLVGNYISYLGSLLNENTRFTNLSSSEINAIMKLIIEWLTDDLDSNAERYGLGTLKNIKINYINSEGKLHVKNLQKFIPNYSEWSRIGHIILNVTFLVLKRSQNGMESRRIFKALSMSDNLGDQQVQNENSSPIKRAFQFWK
jgi:hypothetical protein